MKSNPLQVLTVIFMLLLTVATCSPRRSLPLEGPLTLNEHELQGEKVFMEHCQRCHPGGGKQGLGRQLTVPLVLQSDFKFVMD